MRLAVLLLLYTAVLIRTIAYSYYDTPVPGGLYALQAAYGILLVSEPFITSRLRIYPWIYMGTMFSLVLVMMLVMPTIDFLPTLFYPLSFQAVLFFDRRLGYSWIVAFTLAMFYPIMDGWGWQIEGLAIVILDSIACFLVGSYANMIQRSDLARGANQRLLVEVQEAYRKLQDYAMQVEEQAILSERSRMARELHDSVTQTIFSMNLTVQSARMLWKVDRARVAEQLDRLQELTRSAVSEIQVLVSQLRPHTLADESLQKSLERLIDERQQRDGMQILLEVSGERNLPQSTVSGLYRIVQEALNNVIKHAGTRKAVVRIQLDDRPAYLEIEDRGIGFEPDNAARDLNHIGLAGMSDRARELGWKLEINSHPGRGTRIRIEEAREWQATPVPAAG